MPRKRFTYTAAGVSQARGDHLVDLIAPLARGTHRPEVIASVGGFAALSGLPRKIRNPLLVVSTDGVGTKILLARQLRKFDTVGIDLVAMSVNDVLTVGAEPLLFLDYYATGKLDLREGRAIIGGVAAGCRMAGCALVGGETAEMPQLYRKGDFDLAGFCVGVVEKARVLDGSAVRVGDVVIGIASNGLHSNGFSLVRAILKKSPGLIRPLRGELLRPTRIYVKDVLPSLKKGEISAMAHITGGGIEGNLPRVLPKGCHAEIDRKSWTVPRIFRVLQRSGNVSDAEMFRTFNMGIGFTLVVRPRYARSLCRRIRGASVIGRIVRGSGIPGTAYLI